MLSIISSNLWQEKQPLAGAAVAVAAEAVAGSATAAAATEAVRQKAKVAAVERRASARALTLARSRGSEAAEALRSPELAMPELEISWASEEREELGDEEKEQEEEPEAEKEKEPADEREEKPQEQEEKEPEKEDKLLLCEEPESSKEPEGEVEELEGEKKLEPPWPKLNEEERELEYQQMIDKLNNTLSAALARGERRRRRR
jgi:hypothetical protein